MADIDPADPEELRRLARVHERKGQYLTTQWALRSAASKIEHLNAEVDFYRTLAEENMKPPQKPTFQLEVEAAHRVRDELHYLIEKAYFQRKETESD